VALYRGLSSKPECEGCSCTPLAARCDSSVIGHGAYPCPGFQTTGVSYNVFTTSCEAISPGASVHFYDVSGFAECTPKGTPKPSAAQWAETRTFCKADSVGAGCDPGSRCVPVVTTPACTLTEGAGTCGGDYATTTGAVWNTGLSDKRQCSACQCGFGLSACNGGAIEVFSGANCSGTKVVLGTGAQGDNCAIGFSPVSGRAVGTPASTSCEPNTYPNGELTADGPTTVCCQ
jgi:hypothetical protein